MVVRRAARSGRDPSSVIRFAMTETATRARSGARRYGRALESAQQGAEIAADERSSSHPAGWRGRAKAAASAGRSRQPTRRPNTLIRNRLQITLPNA